MAEVVGGLRFSPDPSASRARRFKLRAGSNEGLPKKKPWAISTSKAFIVSSSSPVSTDLATSKAFCVRAIRTRLRTIRLCSDSVAMLWVHRGAIFTMFGSKTLQAFMLFSEALKLSSATVTPAVLKGDKASSKASSLCTRV